MEQLPDEVLTMILDYLPEREAAGGAARVCRRWAALLRRRAVHAECHQDLDNIHCTTRSIRVVVCIDPLKEFLYFTPCIAPNLRELVMSAINPFKVKHLPLLECSPRLEHLDIFLHDRVLETQMIPYFLRLTSFVINEIVSLGVLRALAVSRLHSLYMYGRSLYYPRKELLLLLRARRFHLRELTLRCTELHDASYAVIGLCEGLTSLQLYSCWLMTSSGVLHMTRPKKLRRLHITGARMVRSRSLDAFLNKIPPLVEELNLSVSWFGDEHIGPLIHRLPKLRVLELWKCRITPQGVLTLAENLIELTALDLDIRLSNEQILQLDRHPSLLFLRCLTGYSVKQNPYMPTPDEPRANLEKVVTKKIKVVACDEKYALRYFRGSGEGYRAALFYHWTQDAELEPLPRNAPLVFDVHDFQ